MIIHIIKNLFPLPALIAGFGLILAGRATAQTFTTLHSFAGDSQGANPHAGLILSGNTLYGTASEIGSLNNGTVFAVKTDGAGFTILYSFTPLIYNAATQLFTNSDGAVPWSGLILSGSTLYGTAAVGGSSGRGTVFALNTDGTGFTNLHSFTTTPDDGAYPQHGLVLSGNTLYGMANQGGSSDNGTIFAVNTDGTGFTNLHSFTATPPYPDGKYPEAVLILSGNTLYGTAAYGGSSGRGTVFALNTDGTGFTNLHSFTATPPSLNPNYTNSDGANPYGGLILSDNTLYGTAVGGGSVGNGTVFALNTDGTGFTNLHSFTATPPYPNYTNSDGANPSEALILSGNTLYGTTVRGGNSGWGTAFAVNTNGTGFTTLYSFTAISGIVPQGPTSPNSDGANPFAGLILSGSSLYGTAYSGGNSGWGTVFSVSLLPQLTIIASGANVILTWPTNAAGFTLQSTTNLLSPAVWSTVSPGPVVVNGQNAVTNPVSGSQQHFRLISN